MSFLARVLSEHWRNAVWYGIFFPNGIQFAVYVCLSVWGTFPPILLNGFSWNLHRDGGLSWMLIYCILMAVVPVDRPGSQNWTVWRDICQSCWLVPFVFIIIIQAGGLSGDGYGTAASPHTVHEAFTGLGLERAAEVGRQRSEHVLK